MILTSLNLSPTDVTTCEACWERPVSVARTSPTRTRDLLCVSCARSGYVPRVVLFPPLGVYGLTGRRIEMGKHAAPKPGLPPNPGPASPSPKPQSPPGTPPV